MTEQEKDLYVGWLLEGNGKPLQEVHCLWEYLYTPKGSDPNLTERDELDILGAFVYRMKLKKLWEDFNNGKN